jgi:hypothetical protein
MRSAAQPQSSWPICCMDFYCSQTKTARRPLWGHSRHLDQAPTTSALPRCPDVCGVARHFASANRRHPMAWYKRGRRLRRSAIGNSRRHPCRLFGADYDIIRARRRQLRFDFVLLQSRSQVSTIHPIGRNGASHAVEYCLKEAGVDSRMRASCRQVQPSRGGQIRGCLNETDLEDAFRLSMIGSGGDMKSRRRHLLPNTEGTVFAVVFPAGRIV